MRQSRRVKSPRHLVTTRGAAFALGGIDGVVRVFGDDGEPNTELRGHQGEIASLAFSPDGQRLVSGGSDGTARVWDWQRGVELAHYQASSGYPVHRLSFAPDGKTFVTSSSYIFETPNLWFTHEQDLLACARRRANPATVR